MKQKELHELTDSEFDRLLAMNRIKSRETIIENLLAILGLGIIIIFVMYIAKLIL